MLFPHTPPTSFLPLSAECVQLLKAKNFPGDWVSMVYAYHTAFPNAVVILCSGVFDSNL